jgi:hypothetical protein
MEQQQNEIDQLIQDRRELETRIQMLSSENSKLRSELQSKSGEIVKLNGQIESLSESDRQLREAGDKLAQSREIEWRVNQKEQDIRKREVTARNTAAKYQALVTEAEKERQNIKEQQKAFHFLVTRAALEQSEQDRQKNRAEYLVRKGVLTGYVGVLAFLLLMVSVLSLIRQQTFLTDLAETGKIIRKGMTVIVSGVNSISLQAVSVTGKIQQPTLSLVVWWIIRIGIPLLSLAVPITIAVLLIKQYGETIKEKGINRWNFSLSVVILTVFIFFGDYVKKVTEFNLIGMWLVSDVILIGAAWYKYGCDENRGWR